MSLDQLIHEATDLYMSFLIKLQGADVVAGVSQVLHTHISRSHRSPMKIISYDYSVFFSLNINEICLFQLIEE